MSNLPITLNRIEELCKNNNLSINEMLIKSNAGARTYHNMKSGSIPSSDKLEKIADFFNVSVDYLLGRTDYPYTIQADENGKPVVMPDDEPPICTDD